MDELLGVLWGYKTEAIFDVWSVEHIFTAISLGYLVKQQHQRLLSKLIGKASHWHSWRINLAAVLCLGYAWEALEHYLETGLAGPGAAYWFQGVEFWANRLVADPLLLILGYALAKQYPALVVPARVFSLVWLLVHLVIFPHSMYLQTLI